jgi:AraC family transcriptional regulator
LSEKITMTTPMSNGRLDQKEARMLMQSNRGAMEVEAELNSPSALVQLVHYHFKEPTESTLCVDPLKVRMELCLTSRHRSARACYKDRWTSHRFERIGEMFLVSPEEIMGTRSDERSSLTSVVCHFSLEPVIELYDHRPPEMNEIYLLGGLDIRNSKIRTLLLWLAEEARNNGLASEMVVESIVDQLTVEIFRHGTSLSEPRGGLARWQLRLIDDRLAQECRAPTLEELATSCRLSVRQLMRGFRASRQCSIGAYAANIQIEHAKRMLAAGTSVAEIAAIFGYSSPSNFSYAFRRSMGVPPGQFRKRLLGSK